MKTHIKNIFRLTVLLAGFVLMLAGRVTAQTFTTLYSFTVTSGSSGVWSYGTNSDGLAPNQGVILSGDTLYGPAACGGGSGNGTVFAVNTDGTGFTVLHTFTATPGDASSFLPSVTNSDGASPEAGLILSGNTLYGTARFGGSGDEGTVFALNTDGTGFKTLHSFTGGNDGGGPIASLILANNTLYGTAEVGGISGDGTVFAVNTDGTGFTNLYSFTATSGPLGPYGFGTNNDGVLPGSLILSGNTLYGTTFFGGSSGNGTVFAVNTDGTEFTNVYTFTATSGPLGPYGFGTNNDGVSPGSLILSGNTLYGAAGFGGSGGNGTVFAVNTDGTGFTVLHTFMAPSGLGPYTNSDGAGPGDRLSLSGYTLYGTAARGGTNGSGTLFSVFIQPQLTLIPSGPYVILTWPTNYSGFTLQSTTKLGSSAVWSTNSSPPVVIGGQNMVINTTTSGKQRFYRLSSP